MWHLYGQALVAFRRKTVSTTLVPSSPWIRGAVVSHTTQMANVSEVTAQVRCPSAMALGWAVPVAVSAVGVYNVNPGGHLVLRDGCTWVVVCLCFGTGATTKKSVINIMWPRPVFNPTCLPRSWLLYVDKALKHSFKCAWQALETAYYSRCKRSAHSESVHAYTMFEWVGLCERERVCFITYMIFLHSMCIISLFEPIVTRIEYYLIRVIINSDKYILWRQRNFISLVSRCIAFPYEQDKGSATRVESHYNVVLSKPFQWSILLHY